MFRLIDLLSCYLQLCKKDQNLSNGISTKMVWKTSEHPVLAKICHSEFLPAFLHQNGLKKFGTPNFGHSKFLLVFCTKMILTFLEWPVLAKIVDSKFFWNYFVQKDREKIGMANFGQNCAFWMLLNHCSVKDWKKFGMANFGQNCGQLMVIFML